MPEPPIPGTISLYSSELLLLSLSLSFDEAFYFNLFYNFWFEFELLLWEDLDEFEPEEDDEDELLELLDDCDLLLLFY